MTESDDSRETAASERIRSILVLIATICMSTFNWMAAVGYLNGVKPGEISEKYATIVTPADWAFTLWSLIYLGLFAFSIYQLFPSQIARFRPIRSVYIVSCILNCAWIYFYIFEMTVVSMGAVIVLWLVLLLIVAKLSGFRGLAETWLLQAPFGIYFGWVTSSALVNFAMMLVYLGPTPVGHPGPFFGSLLLVVGAVIAVIVRVRFHNFFFPLAVAWAVTAIAVKNSSETMIVVVSALVVVACLITSGSVVTVLKDSTSE